MSRFQAALVALSLALALPPHTALAFDWLTVKATGPMSESDVLTFAASPAPPGMENRFTLRLNRANLELLDSQTGTILRSQALASVRSVDIQGADGETNDTLTVDFSGGMFSVPGGIHYDGGVGGFDTLVIAGGTAVNERYEMKNANDGTITIDDLRIVFSNIEPINDTVPSSTIVISGTSAGEAINIVNGPVVSGFQTTQVNSSTFELVNFANKGTATINGLAGNDTFTLNVTSAAAGLSTLIVDGGGDPSDTASVANFVLPGGTLSLQGMNTITQSGPIQVTNLAVQSSGGVSLLSVPNTVSTLAGSAGGAFDFANTTSMVIGTVQGVVGINDTASAADVTVTVNGGSNVLTVNQPITTAGAIVILTADDMAINAGVSATSSGLVILTPFTVARTMVLGTNLAGTLGLTDAEMDFITANILQLGSALPQFAGNVVVTSPISQAGSGYSIFQINTTAAVASIGGSIAATNLDIFSGTGIGSAGTALATQVNNLDFSNSTSGVVNISNAGALTIANVAGSGTAFNSGNTTLTAGGSVMINVALSSGGSLGLNCGAVAQSAAIQATALEILGSGPVTLTNSSNSVGNLAANITGAFNYTNAGSLSVVSVSAIGLVGASGVTTSNAAITINTVAGDLSFLNAVNAGTGVVTATAGSTGGSPDHLLTNSTAVTGSSAVFTADRMSLAGTVNASNTMTIQSNTLSRPVNLDNTAGDPAGELRLSQTELNTLTAGAVRIGRSDDIAGMTLKFLMTNPAGWSTLHLIAGGTIGQSGAGTFSVPNLALQAGGGVALLSVTSLVTNLAGSAGGVFDFGNAGSLLVGTVDGIAGINDTASAADVTLTVNGAGNVMTVNQPITTAGAIIVLTADDMTINAGVSATGSGIVILTPFTIARTMNLGTNTVGNLGLTDAELDRITTNILQLGSALPQFAGNVVVTAPISQAGSGYAILQLNTTAAVSNGGGSIAGNNLDIFSGTGIGTGTPLATQVNNLDFNNVSGVVNISNTGSLTITNVANASNAVNNGTTTTLSATGALTFAVNTTSAGALTVTTTETGSESGTPLPSPDENIIVNAGITVKSTGGGVVFTSADAIIIGTGAIVTGSILTYTSGSGDNDNDCLSPLLSTGTSAPAGGMSGSFNVNTFGGVCTWSASSDSVWLTTSSTGTGSGSVSFTVAANTLVTGRAGHINAGGQVYTVTQSGVLPANLVATATSTSSIALTWTSTAVDHFEVWRNSGAGFVLLFSPLTASYTDSSVVANAAYLYKVRAVDSTATASAYSNLDLATTILFTDDPLVPGSSFIKAIHLTQLRQAVTAVATLAGTGVPAFTDPAPAGVFIKLVHVTELRSPLDAARTALGLPPLTYTAITTGSPVSATDITQLRNGVK